MAKTGLQLRQARKAKGMSLQDAAESTRLRSDQILALETGEYRVFNAPVYVLGSIKTYAKALGLDPEPMLDELRKELKENPLRFPRSDSVTMPPAGSGRDPVAPSHWKMAISLLLLLLIVGLGSFSLHHMRERREAQIPFRPESGMYGSLKQDLPLLYLPLPNPPDPPGR